MSKIPQYLLGHTKGNYSDEESQYTESQGNSYSTSQVPTQKKRDYYLEDTQEDAEEYSIRFGAMQQKEFRDISKLRFNQT